MHLKLVWSFEKPILDRENNNRETMSACKNDFLSKITQYLKTKILDLCVLPVRTFNIEMTSYKCSRAMEKSMRDEISSRKIRRETKVTDIALRELLYLNGSGWALSFLEQMAVRAT